MTVTCPHCRTTYRVDPQKIPQQGVRARCAICRGAFRIEGTAPAPAAGPTTVAAPNSERAEAVPPQATVASSTAASAAAASASREPAPAGGAAPSATAALPTRSVPPAAAPAAPRAASPFAADPHARARRLARALISDIVMYHPDRRDRALRAGTLRTEFREEIRKSWEEYVAQVGPEIAQSTPYFREALNDILAQGQKIF